MPTVLVVDDKAVARRTVLSVLKLEFADAVTCIESENGTDGVEKVEALHPDIVILDLVMPGMNGLNAARKIAEECPNTKVLAISMYDAKPLYEQLLRARVRGFVPKSSLGVELAPAVESLLSGKTFFGLPCSFPTVAAAVV